MRRSTAAGVVRRVVRRMLKSVDHERLDRGPSESKLSMQLDWFNSVRDADYVNEEIDSVGTYLRFDVGWRMNKKLVPAGFGMGRIAVRHRSNDCGRLVKLTPTAASNGVYSWWWDSRNVGKLVAAKVEVPHHLCRGRHPIDCKAKDFEGINVVHVGLRRSFPSEESALDHIRGWKWEPRFPELEDGNEVGPTAPPHAPGVDGPIERKRSRRGPVKIHDEADDDSQCSEGHVMDDE